MPRSTSVVVTEEVRAKALGLILSGENNSAVGKALGLKPYQVTRIKQSLPPEQLKEIVDTKRDVLGELVLEALVENLRAQKAISRQFQDKDWLDRQPAGDLAVGYGVHHDKGFRMLAAMEAAGAIEKDEEHPCDLDSALPA